MSQNYAVPANNMTSAPAAYPNASQTFNATAVAPVIEPAPVPTAAVYAPTQSVYNATAAPVQEPTGSGRGFFPSCDDVFPSFSLFSSLVLLLC